MTKTEILNYIMETPNNTNWGVLKSLIGDNPRLYKYITETPYNMNRAVLSGILDSTETEYYDTIFDEQCLFSIQGSSGACGYEFTDLDLYNEFVDGDKVIITIDDVQTIGTISVKENGYKSLTNSTSARIGLTMTNAGLIGIYIGGVSAGTYSVTIEKKTEKKSDTTAIVGTAIVNISTAGQIDR